MIDLNRGVSMRTHPKGFKVCMYKDQPGIYTDMSGNVISETVANEAGFPVEKLARERERLAKLMAMTNQVNAEFGQMVEGTAVYSTDGWAAVYKGDGSFGIQDPDGNLMPTKDDLTKNAAINLVKKMAKSEAPEEKPKEE